MKLLEVSSSSALFGLVSCATEDLGGVESLGLLVIIMAVVLLCVCVDGFSIITEVLENCCGVALPCGCTSPNRAETKQRRC